MTGWLTTTLALTAALSAGGGCVAAAGGSRAALEPGARAEARTCRVTGRARFEVPARDGRGPLTLRPARRVTVRALDAAARVVAVARADEAGRFELAAPRTIARVEALAAVEQDALEAAPARVDAVRGEPSFALRVVALDDASDAPYALAADLAPGACAAPTNERAAAPARVELAALVTPEGGPAGAFHILDTLLSGARAVRRWSGRALPELVARRHDGPGSVGTDYTGRSRASFAPRYELTVGHAAGTPPAFWQDHDEPTVLHEMGHFVFDRLSSSTPLGGQHDPSLAVVPSVAWEEGRATWFAAAVLATGAGDDGDDGDGSGAPSELRRRGDDAALRAAWFSGLLERGSDVQVRGLCSELTTTQVLWDLTDGAGGVRDEDGDALALGPAAVFRAMLALRGDPSPAGTLATLLRRLVADGAASDAQVCELLQRPEDQQIPWPPESSPQGAWPPVLRPGAPVRAEVDSRTAPRDLRGRHALYAGVDAMHVYRFELLAAARVQLRMALGPAPGGDEGVHLLVFDRHHHALAPRRTGHPAVDTLEQELPAGTYMAVVRSDPGVHRARYELVLRQPAAATTTTRTAQRAARAR